MQHTSKYTELNITDGEKVENFSFRPLDPNQDVELLYDWMHQKHIAPFWKLNLPLSELKRWVHHSAEAEHKDCYIGTFNGEPVCYLIAYSVEEDPIKEYYDDKQGDLGMHLLIGPRSYLNKEDGLSIVRAMILFLFDRYNTKRIIGEPDRRNRIVIPILKELGGEVLGRVHLPNKEAALIAGEKEAVFAKLREKNIDVTIHTSMTVPGNELV
ncbi:Protein N-acetyltransferase, RimJ/RimL family [Halobacillus alkaliphilus]|uniref:Lysine N-acyltransferase MbtK n=1 Tax=Halobacillus alkaliphilus TaxID=396056 RepID=A0A1I2PI26_9BACI|nr:GNAT family N-acetyltransferase [Halobacillus alkaliphilus]SFG15845.1 Protein N-acetyltransferase, RimJ/RimL family [Halobacillus alkaliphilus]